MNTNTRRSSRSRRTTRLVAGTSLAAALALVATSGDSWGRKRMVLDEDFSPSARIGFDGPAIGGRTAPEASAPASLASSPIAMVGDRSLVIDADSGELVLADANGKVLSRLAVGRTSSQLVYDTEAKRAYVADRSGDRVVQVDVGDKLSIAGEFATATEPFGLALAPDRKTLLVTHVADRTLTAYEPTSGKELWSHVLAREPRGVAISPDGKRAAVGYLATGTVELVDMTEHTGHHVALEAPGTSQSFGRIQRASNVQKSVTGQDTGRAFARNAFAVRFIGHGLTVAAHSLSTPVQNEAFRENTGSYGGGFNPPISHRLAFMAGAEAQVGVTIGVHQPQALAWDAKTDTLYVAGYGSDDIMIINHASQADAQLGGQFALAQKEACGPQGLAVGDDGSVTAWCGLSRTIVKGTRKDQTVAFAQVGDAALTKTHLTKDQHRGEVLFRTANDGRLSSRGALACASCHPEGRADGLSWRIEKHELQTPLLSGKVAGTHPFKWDGGDKDLSTSISSTMRRLGGGGLPAADAKALAAFLEAMPAPRTPRRDVAAVDRGKEMFESELGCASCHAGGLKTDREKHTFGSDTLATVDTPALVGLAYSAPYFHDGSAATLEALLADNGLVHGMAETSGLSDAEIVDLVAYLETL
jgi:DNA-binding beta-propeller fold protein YncE